MDRIIISAVESGLVQYWMSNFNRGKFGFGHEAYKVGNVEQTLRDIFEYIYRKIDSQG
jgi:hypothetical protein